MDGTRIGDARDSRFDELHAEAKAALGYSANTIDTIAGRYREAFLEDLARYQVLRDELDAFERRPHRVRTIETRDDLNPSKSHPVGTMEAAEAGAEDARFRALRSQVESLAMELGARKSELARLELAHKSLESTWLFLERGDASLVPEGSGADRPHDVEMRIVEAQEAERTRLAQEIHDGPAQALSNAIFQVEYIERVMDQDARVAGMELRHMRELLRRELGDVRTFISQLHPPLLDELGLDGAIQDTAETWTTLMGATVETDLRAPGDRLAEAQQTVVLRVVQEALQNVRKHAGATLTTIATRIEDGRWIVEVRDDGRGFDAGAVATRGRRNFGLQFMRERAGLIGATLEVSSRPEAGTVVRLAIPIEEESR
jgi:two-component system sensor histidine kinase DegS